MIARTTYVLSTDDIKKAIRDFVSNSQNIDIDEDADVKIEMVLADEFKATLETEQEIDE